MAVLLERDGKSIQAIGAYTRARDLLHADPDFVENDDFQDFARRSQAAIDRLLWAGD